uniref:Uncharacterized protein n=1 Tax=Molossus molossus TaxID=27622 RepID=A0A7J8EDX6_MOLMO|nr:hypothetical protein HJG59_008809 [Molossus molossus]
MPSVGPAPASRTPGPRPVGNRASLVHRLAGWAACDIRRGSDKWGRDYLGQHASGEAGWHHPHFMVMRRLGAWKWPRVSPWWRTWHSRAAAGAAFEARSEGGASTVPGWCSLDAETNSQKDPGDGADSGDSRPPDRPCAASPTLQMREGRPREGP